MTHEDSYFISKFENVTVRFKTAGDCEEIIKSKFIGEYCSTLSEELNYKGKIFIDLIHDYTKVKEPSSFISFDNGEYESIWNNEKSIISSTGKKQKIIIRHFQYTFDISKILVELEYTIKNLDSIKEETKELKYKSNLDDVLYLIKSIPIESIKRIHKLEKSKLVKNVLTKRIKRPENNDYYQLSYFTQNGKYFLFYGDHAEIEIIDSVKNIYSFNRHDSFTSFIFISPKEFFCIYENILSGERTVTAHHIINTIIDHYYQSVSVDLISDQIFTITHYLFGIDNVAAFYLKDQFLIHNFTQELMNLNKNKN